MRILMLILILCTICLAKWPDVDTLTVEYGKPYWFYPTKQVSNTYVIAFYIDGIPWGWPLPPLYESVKGIGPFYFPQTMFDGNTHILRCTSDWDESWRLKTTLYNSIEQRSTMGSGSVSSNGLTYDILGRKTYSRQSNGFILKKHVKILNLR